MIWICLKMQGKLASNAINCQLLPWTKWILRWQSGCIWYQSILWRRSQPGQDITNWDSKDVLGIILTPSHFDKMSTKWEYPPLGNLSYESIVDNRPSSSYANGMVMKTQNHINYDIQCWRQARDNLTHIVYPTWWRESDRMAHPGMGLWSAIPSRPSQYSHQTDVVWLV